MRNDSVSVPVYPFAWLDEVTEYTLNPEKQSVDNLQEEELYQLQGKFETEIHQVLNSLKSQTFWIISEKKKKAVLQQYVHSIRLLQQQAVNNQKNYPEGSLLKAAGNAIISYLEELFQTIERRYNVSLPDLLLPEDQADQNPTLIKIICELSIDQMGIILKAADDIKLIVSRSLSQVFKSIVPFLSTSTKDSLSWDSMRSNSYHPEKRDKEIAINALEALIKKIKEY
ncbi:hypothetical protein KXQ82_04455 [Mucilaginibacter sp. HMF5004]|uniref:hypothetical protein n=1 Tax=Mucilaginibacter rivuli TaxID=2857527 RepID=UPI001C5E8DB1|nr:hypothetical protein [Mucilaginibacter rivuli]MBW4888949.1 hypothetical protein [Mucilaginibacter rivuli]